MKTSELAGEELDFWVAKAEGHKGTIVGPRFLVHERSDGLHVGTPGGGWHFAPSTEWKQGGPIIERECIDLQHGGNNGAAEEYEWAALAPTREGVNMEIGETPLIAAMRAYVASKFGDDVEDKC